MQIPYRGSELTEVFLWENGHLSQVQDSLAVEEPLDIRVNDEPMTVTMRTPGHDQELAVGLLLSEGVIQELEQISKIDSVIVGNAGKANTVHIYLPHYNADHELLHRNFPVSSACGICGRSSIESIRVRDLARPLIGRGVSSEVLCGLPDKLRASQKIFSRTGGLHGAGLFNSAGEMLVSREDIGRHNAVDKVIGWALLEKRLPLSDTVLMVSGRTGFEIVQKALAAGIPVVASVSAPSSLAVQLARELGLTLVGFLRGSRFIIYSGAQRCVSQEKSKEFYLG